MSWTNNFHRKRKVQLDKYAILQIMSVLDRGSDLYMRLDEKGKSVIMIITWA